MKKAGMKASSIRSLLAVLFVVLILGVAGGFYLVLQQIKAYAVDVSHTVVDSEASGNQINELQTLKQELQDREQLVKKANTLFATSGNYQSQALSDVQRYAQRFGVTISNTSFEPLAEGSTKPIFVITLQSPVSYTNLLKFLDAIEGNLPKMQVTSVTLGTTGQASGGNVTTEDIKIEIATR